MLVHTGMYHFEVSRTALYQVRYVLARNSTYHLVLPCTRCTGFQMLACQSDRVQGLGWHGGMLTWAGVSDILLPRDSDSRFLLPVSPGVP